MDRSAKIPFLAANFRADFSLDICLEYVYKAQDIVGSRFVMLECMDIPQVVSFYKSSGFTLLQMDSKDKYLQMVKRL